MPSILLIEDDYMYAGQVYAKLSMEGHMVTWANDLGRAMEVFHLLGDFSLVLTDTCVNSRGRPDADALVRTLRQENETLPIIGMSSNFAHQQLMMRAGCSDFYEKSIEDDQLDVLMRMVERFLPSA